MGATGALQLAGAAVSAYGSYQQGKTEQATAEANALIYEAQAKNIEEAKKITDAQYRTKANVLRGQAITTAARNGVRISGTTANSISQSIMQLQMDNAYEQYNLDLRKQNAFSNAALQRFQGKSAFTNGLFQAGSTALNAGIDYHNKYWKNTGNNENAAWNWAKDKINKVKKNNLFSGGLLTNQNTYNHEDTIIR